MSYLDMYTLFYFSVSQFWLHTNMQVEYSCSCYISKRSVFTMKWLPKCARMKLMKVDISLFDYYNYKSCNAVIPRIVVLAPCPIRKCNVDAI